MVIGMRRKKSNLKKHTKEQVDRFNVGQLGKGVACVTDQCGHSQDRRDAQGDAGGHGIAVDPKRQPRQTRDHRRRNVGLDDVVGDVTAEVEVGADDRVVSD